MPRVTISEVAAAAGVSIATASKALNGTASIAPDTVRRIQHAAETLGYKPNRAAQLLAGKNKHIGILMPSEPEPIFALFEAGLTASLAGYEEYGFRPTLVKYNPTDAVAAFCEGLAKLHDIHGLIFIGQTQLAPIADALRAMKLPKVSLQVAADESLCPSVTVDERGVGRIAAEFLSLTCKTAAVIVGDGSVTIHRRNVDGFREEAARHGLTVTAVYERFDRFETAAALTEQLIASGCPDGIIVSSYVAPAVCACLQAHGLAGRVRVIGVDIWEKSAACLEGGALTAAICQNQQLQAMRAVDMLVSMMRGDAPSGGILIKPELVMPSALRYYM